MPIQIEKPDNRKPGKRGLRGKQGIQGVRGVQGVQGIKGADGRNGIDGKDGSKWYDGKGAPEASLGATGDFYLDNDTYDYYEKTTRWVKRGNLKGAKGDKGDKGDKGERGAKGAKGNDGGVGTPGADGAQGPQGPQGMQGVQGDPGVGVPTGGTTGQVLAKDSDTDYDTEWVDQTGGGGISIGDTVGGTPANGGILYADNSDTLRANHWSTGTSSYAGGAVTGIKFEQQVIADAPRFEVLNLSGFGIPNAFALATSTDPFSFFLTDTDTLTTYVAMTINPATPASSNVTFGLASGTSSNPEFALTTTSLGLRVPVDMNTNKITELDTPTAGGDAVNKTYADAIIPSQTGNSGKYLTTNGSAVSWGTVSASPGGSDTQIQFNSSGSFAGDSRLLWVDWAWGGGAFGKYLQVGTSSQGQGILMPKVNKESWVAIGPQGNYGNDFAQDEPHVAINTVRLIGNGGGSLSLRTHTNANTVTLFVANMAAASYVTPSNGIKGFYLTENGGNNAATITMGPTDQGFFARKARLQAQCETGLITADATINTIQAKAQTSQTGNLFDAVNTSGTRLWGVDQNGGMKPASMADGTAANDTVYYSTTASKLVYKDGSGNVQNLY